MGFGVVGLGLVAHDLYEAKDSEERLRIVSNFVQVTIVLGAAGAPGKVIGAAGVGYAVGTKVARHFIPDAVNLKIGQTLVEQVTRSPENSFLDPIALPIGKFIVEHAIGARPEDFY
jgi:hypothetical protein